MDSVISLTPVGRGTITEGMRLLSAFGVKEINNLQAHRSQRLDCTLVRPGKRFSLKYNVLQPHHLVDQRLRWKYDEWIAVGHTVVGLLR